MVVFQKVNLVSNSIFLFCVANILCFANPCFGLGSNGYFAMSGSGSYDLSLQKLADTPGPFSPGQDVTFSIIVTNEGDCDAANIMVTDFLPPDLSLSTSDTNGWLAIGNNVMNTINFLSAAVGNNQVIVPIILTIDPLFTGTTITNQAAITADDGNDIDSDPDSGFVDDEDGDGNPIDDDESEATIAISPILNQAILQLYARNENAGVQLEWEILSDQIFTHFIIEYYLDEWIPIDEVVCVPNAIQYEKHFDPDILESRHVRIKAIGQGQIELLSNVEYVGWVHAPAQFSCHPNPTRSTIKMDFYSEFEGKVSIYDSYGRLKIERVVAASEVLVVSTWSTGLYHVFCSVGNRVIQQKFIVSR